MNREEYNLADGIAKVVEENMRGLEREVVFRRFLVDYEHEQIAAELDIPVELSQQIAARGLHKIRQAILPRPD